MVNKKKLLRLTVILALAATFSTSIVLAGEMTSELESRVNSAIKLNEQIPVIIQLGPKANTSHIAEIKSEGASMKHQHESINAVTVEIPIRAARNIAGKPFVETVEPDYNVELVLDQSTSQIKASKVWNKSITGKDIDVAVTDTGIHNEHEALTVEKEKDFTGEGTDDGHGHGTHVAGIVSSDDSTYKGIAPDSDLFNAKVLDSSGSGTASDVIEGIEWAVNNGAEVISISLGAKVDNCDGTDALSETVDWAVNNGVTTVVSAGNAGPDNETITIPGCSKKAVTVGASDSNDEVPDFSSRGPTADGRVKPDVVAPGVSITSSWNDGGWTGASGTSMSTPHVSGLAALMLEANQTLSTSDIKTNIKSTAKDLGLDENTQGEGRVNAKKAVDSIWTGNQTQETYLNITDFTTSQSRVVVNNSFNTTLSIEARAQNVSSLLSLPQELTTTEEERYHGEVSGNTSTKWTVDTETTGNYTLLTQVTSLKHENEASAEVEVYKPSSNETEKNETEKNETEDRNKTQNKTGVPPGLAKQNKTLPPGLAKKAGSTPGSFGYGVERLLEKADVFFTFNPQKKAKKKMEYAEERMAEAALMSASGNEEKAMGLVSEYQENVEKARQLSEKVKDKKEKDDIEKAIENSSKKHKEVLDQVEEKVPEPAKEAIQNALEKPEQAMTDYAEEIEDGEDNKSGEKPKKAGRNNQSPGKPEKAGKPEEKEQAEETPEAPGKPEQPAEQGEAGDKEKPNTPGKPEQEEREQPNTPEKPEADEKGNSAEGKGQAQEANKGTQGTEDKGSEGTPAPEGQSEEASKGTEGKSGNAGSTAQGKDSETSSSSNVDSLIPDSSQGQETNDFKLPEKEEDMVKDHEEPEHKDYDDIVQENETGYNPAESYEESQSSGDSGSSSSSSNAGSQGDSGSSSDNGGGPSGSPGNSGSAGGGNAGGGGGSSGNGGGGGPPSNPGKP